MITVIILTYNDEVQIENCLRSLEGLTDDIVVIDSYSEDETQAICRRYAARFFQNPFVNQAIQFNWALDNIEFKHEWILRLDSDEVIPEKLRVEIIDMISNNPAEHGFYLNRRMYWMGRWLRHGRMYPHYILRLFRLGSGRYEERTEEHMIVEGPVGYMKNDFLEDNKKTHSIILQKSIYKLRPVSFVKFLKKLMSMAGAGLEARFFGAKVNRTRWLKQRVYARVPLFTRPLLYFIYRYVFCLGFLDGKPGLIFHVLQGFWYRFYIDSKVYESELPRVDRDFRDI